MWRTGNGQRLGLIARTEKQIAARPIDDEFFQKVRGKFRVIEMAVQRDTHFGILARPRSKRRWRYYFVSPRSIRLATADKVSQRVGVCRLEQSEVFLGIDLRMKARTGAPKIEIRRRLPA